MQIEGPLACCTKIMDQNHSHPSCGTKSCTKIMVSLAVLAMPCRWVQGECASLGDMDAPEVDPRLHRAAQALRQRQVLFRYCAEEVATARHNAMFQRCTCTALLLYLRLVLIHVSHCPQYP